MNVRRGWGIASLIAAGLMLVAVADAQIPLPHAPKAKPAPAVEPSPPPTEPPPVEQIPEPPIPPTPEAPPKEPSVAPAPPADAAPSSAPVPMKLPVEPVTPTPPPITPGAKRAAPIEPARPLPPTGTVCQDRKTKRCWHAAKGVGCPGATVFVVVIDLPGRFDVDDALTACQEQFKHEP